MDDYQIYKNSDKFLQILLKEETSIKDKAFQTEALGKLLPKIKIEDAFVKKEGIFYENQLSEKEFSTLVSLRSKKVSLLEDEVYLEYYLQVIDILFSYTYDLK